MNEEMVVPKSDPKTHSDQVAEVLRSIAQNVFIAVLGLSPILFFSTYLSVDSNKTLVVSLGLFVALIFLSLSTLRSGQISMAFPLAWWGLWGVVGMAVFSAILSGDRADAWMGNVVGTQSVMFLIQIALVTTLGTLLLNNKAAILRLYTILGLSTVVLAAFHWVRIIWGADTLAFGIFTQSTSSPLGGWNDVALFFGFVILIGMVALEQLPLTRWGQVLTGGVLLVSLATLAVINFYALWFVLGLVSLVQLIYSLTKERFQVGRLAQDTEATNVLTIILALVVFVTSLTFIVGGNVVSNVLSDWTNVSYVEVRPSFEATADIAKSVYEDNAFTGIGANRFADAWRLHKDPAINETIFWNNEFRAGNGYITTQFITTGLLGGLLWICFLGSLVYAGLRILFQSAFADRFWYFVATSSFVASLYLWLMFAIYVPGAAMLFLAATSTGVLFAAYFHLLPQARRHFSVAMNRQGGFILIAVTMVVMVASISVLYVSGRYFYAHYLFNQAVATANAGAPMENVERQIADAFLIVKDDVFAGQLALYQLGKLNSLLTLVEPTEEEQRQFQNALANGINSAEQAIALDPTEARYHAILGSIYSVLATANLEGASERATNAFARARQFDPLNPEYALLEAQLLSRLGDVTAARAKVTEAVSLKRNYTDAYYFLSQLDIAAGNTAAAVEATRAIISLEPNNPARRYQLGVLLASLQDNAGAIGAFEQAVRLDPNYANARYFLALAYLEEDRRDNAVEQLEIVASLNPDNTDVADLITQIKSGDAITSAPTIVEEPTAAETDDGSISADMVPDSDLLSPVNAGVNGASDGAASDQSVDSSLVSTNEVTTSTELSSTTATTEVE